MLADPGRVLVSAHRGRCGADGLPALERYRRAVALGVDHVELDVRTTADGVMVAFHDRVLPSGREIGEVTHEAFAEELGPEAVTVAALLDAAAGRVGVHIDLKEAGREEAIVELALARCAPEQFAFTSLEDESILAIKTRWPHVRCGLALGRSGAGWSPWARAAVRMSELAPGRRLRACRADFIAAHHDLARLSLLAHGARAGLPVWVWTVNEEAAMGRLLRDPRVAVLITDRPDLALALRDGRGAP
jgi:glycerophosphoryl diester phosphodiesterase